MSQVTFSCAAAWIASYSCGATTPRKLPFWRTFAPGMWLIERRRRPTAPSGSCRHRRRPGRAAGRYGRGSCPGTGCCARRCTCRSPSPGCRSAAARGDADQRVLAHGFVSGWREAGTGGSEDRGRASGVARAHLTLKSLPPTRCAVGDGLAAARDDALRDGEASRPARRGSSRPCRAAPGRPRAAAARTASGRYPTSRSSRPRPPGVGGDVRCRLLSAVVHLATCPC